MTQARWRVTGQNQREDLSRDGYFTTVVDIAFELLDTGNRGTITVPLTHYTPDYVAGMIQQRADTMLDVARLGTE